MYINLELDGCIATVEVEDIKYTPEYLGSIDEPPEPAMVEFDFKVVFLLVNDVSLELTEEQSLDIFNSLSQYDVEYLESCVLELLN